MRILHLNPGNLFGGIETYLLTLAGSQAVSPRMAHSFFLTSQGRLSRGLEALGADIHVGPHPRLSRPWTVAASRRALLRVLERVRPDVVIAHGPWPVTMWGPAVRASGRKLVLHQHVHVRPDWLDRLASLVKPDAVIANSRFTASSTARGWPLAPVFIVHTPVCPPTAGDRDATREELGVRDGEVLILQVSRFEPWKGHLLHVEALRRVRSSVPWRALFAGGAKRRSERRLEARIRARARCLSPGRLSLLGERSDVSRLMQAADIFCQPNEGPEPFGLVFVEALAAGVPVVTTRMGGAVEIVDESCGRLCDPAPESVAGALEELIESPTLRRTLGERGPQRAADLCDVSASLTRLHAVLGEVVGAEEPDLEPRSREWA